VLNESLMRAARLSALAPAPNTANTPAPADWAQMHPMMSRRHVNEITINQSMLHL
jgi:hypothetical protein